MTEDVVTLNELSTPGLAPHVRMRWDAARSRWVLLAPERVYVPDAIAIEILRRLDGQRSIGAIVDELTVVYQAPRATIAADVIELLSDLVHAQLVDP